jgi:hypothetical protein
MEGIYFILKKTEPRKIFVSDRAVTDFSPLYSTKAMFLCDLYEIVPTRCFPLLDEYFDKPLTLAEFRELMLDVLKTCCRKKTVQKRLEALESAIQQAEQKLHELLELRRVKREARRAFREMKTVLIIPANKYQLYKFLGIMKNAVSIMRSDVYDV